MRTGALVCPVVVGREAELERLEIALEETRYGRGAVVAVTGEAGVGKTRLVDELAARARHRGVTVSYTHLTLPTICSV